MHTPYTYPVNSPEYYDALNRLLGNAPVIRQTAPKPPMNMSATPVPPTNSMFTPLTKSELEASNRLVTYYRTLVYSNYQWATNSPFYTNTRLPFVLGSSFYTNWVTTSRTTPVCNMPGCLVAHVGSQHQSGTVYSNALLIVTYQGAQYTNVLSSSALPERVERDISDRNSPHMTFP